MLRIPENVRQWARAIRRDTLALYLAARDPRTPWYAKGLAAFVAAYALSPVDLIPDFIPVLGYLDDLLLVPGGLWLAVRLVPAEVMEECRERASQLTTQPASAGAVLIIAMILVTAAIAAGWLAYRAVAASPG